LDASAIWSACALICASVFPTEAILALLLAT